MKALKYIGFTLLGIIVLFVAWSVFRGRQNNLAGTMGAAPGGPGSVQLRFGLPLSDYEYQKLSSWIAHIKEAARKRVNGWSEEGIVKSANENGLSVEQGYMLAALWQMHKTSAFITQERYTELYNILKGIGQ